MDLIRDSHSKCEVILQTILEVGKYLEGWLHIVSVSLFIISEKYEQMNDFVTV